MPLMEVSYIILHCFIRNSLSEIPTPLCQGSCRLVNYSTGFKVRMVQRMSGPERISANALSKEVGVDRFTPVRSESSDQLGPIRSRMARIALISSRLRLMPTASATGARNPGGRQATLTLCEHRHCGRCFLLMVVVCLVFCSRNVPGWALAVACCLGSRSSSRSQTGHPRRLSRGRADDDLGLLAVLVDERHHHLCLQSSSACSNTS